jgi:hypothetical protein
LSEREWSLSSESPILQCGQVINAGLLSLAGGPLLDYRPNFANQPGQPFYFGGGSDEGSIVCLRGAIDKGCTRQRLDGAQKS